MKKLILYGTLGCHLCEEALSVISLLPADSYQLVEADIIECDDLMHMYATRIPVLYRPDNQLELDWPFDAEVLEAFIKAE